MATVIELVRTLRLLSGMQGTGPTTIVDAQGVEQVLVQFVKDAYTDIQNLRVEWTHLENSRTFSTVAGKSTYTYLEIFGTATPNFKKANLQSFIITDSNGKKYYLRYLDPEVFEARYLNDTGIQGLPTEFTIDTAAQTMTFKSVPRGVFSVKFRYWEKPEVLTSDTQTPKLPSHFHNLILYKALSKVAVYLNAPHLYQEYAAETAKMEGQLMRMNLKKKRMTTGAFV